MVSMEVGVDWGSGTPSNYKSHVGIIAKKRGGILLPLFFMHA